MLSHLPPIPPATASPLALSAYHHSQQVIFLPTIQVIDRMDSSIEITQTSKSQRNTNEGRESWESIDENLERSRATERGAEKLTTQQLDRVLGVMRVVLAFEKLYDSTVNGCSKANYGVYTQGRVFKIAEMEIIILRLEQRLAAERRRERQGGLLYCSWRRMRKAYRKLGGLLVIRGRQGNHRIAQGQAQLTDRDLVS